MNQEENILIFGGNEFSSAIAISLFNCGFRPILSLENDEIYLQHHLCFGDTIHHGGKIISGVESSILSEDLLSKFNETNFSAQQISAIEYLKNDKKLPVINQINFNDVVELVQPNIIVMTGAKNKENIAMDKAKLVIGLYPEYIPREDCHFAIESRLNYCIGMKYSSKSDIYNKHDTDTHFFKNPFSECYTPIEGIWISLKEIGQKISYNEPLGKVNDIEIRSPYDGQIWGLSHSGKFVAQKSPVALIYEALPTIDYREFSFRDRIIAGSALELILQYK
jgi:hypothetical protein